jgi:hypothetical protein
MKTTQRLAEIVIVCVLVSLAVLEPFGVWPSAREIPARSGRRPPLDEARRPPRIRSRSA